MHGDGHASQRLLSWWSELDQEGGGGIGFEDPGHSRGGRATLPLNEISPVSTNSSVRSPVRPARSVNRLPLTGTSCLQSVATIAMIVTAHTSCLLPQS